MSALTSKVLIALLFLFLGTGQWNTIIVGDIKSEYPVSDIECIIRASVPLEQSGVKCLAQGTTVIKPATLSFSH